MPFLILFILIPIAEIYAFIAVGDEIGAFKTIILCILTAMIGGVLVRRQGLELLMKAQSSLRTGNMPVNEIFNGFCIVIAGIFLLIPGFVTDIIGFLLLTPLFRHVLHKIVLKYGKFSVSETSYSQKPYQNNEDIIEGQYQDISNDHERLDK